MRKSHFKAVQASGFFPHHMKPKWNFCTSLKLWSAQSPTWSRTFISVCLAILITKSQSLQSQQMCANSAAPKKTPGLLQICGKTTEFTCLRQEQTSLEKGGQACRASCDTEKRFPQAPWKYWFGVNYRNGEWGFVSTQLVLLYVL